MKINKLKAASIAIFCLVSGFLSEAQGMEANADEEMFSKGVLIYRPQKGSDEGRIDLKISELQNPLEGTFNLSECLWECQNKLASDCLSISTGYHKGIQEDNKDKIEIWLTPRFLVENEIEGNAKHFKDIFLNEEWPTTAPVGIIWRWHGWKNEEYGYLTSQSMSDLGNNTLFGKCNEASWTKENKRPGNPRFYTPHSSFLQKFTLVFPDAV